MLQTPSPQLQSTLRAERLALLLWGLQARTYHQTLEQIQLHLDSFGLTIMEFDVLAHVALEPGLTQQHLAERLTVTKGNVTYQLGKLERQNLIQRRSAGRSNHLYLTGGGQALVDRVVPGQNALHVQRFAGLSADEQALLASLLRRMLTSTLDV